MLQGLQWACGSKPWQFKGALLKPKNIAWTRPRRPLQRRRASGKQKQPTRLERRLAVRFQAFRHWGGSGLCQLWKVPQLSGMLPVDWPRLRSEPM